MQRKKMLMESPAGDAAKDEERTRKLRKRNAELMAQMKTLEDKCKSLKSDSDHQVTHTETLAECVCGMHTSYPPCVQLPTRLTVCYIIIIYKWVLFRIRAVFRANFDGP